MIRSLASQLMAPTKINFLGSLSILVLRIVVGLAFVLHGWGKIQSPFSWMPPQSGVQGVFQALAALSEFGGGLALIIGLFVPLASLGIFCTMAVATIFHSLVWGHSFIKNEEGSFELPLVYLCVMLVLMSVGGGFFSLDRYLFRKS